MLSVSLPKRNSSQFTTIYYSACYSAIKKWICYLGWFSCSRFTTMIRISYYSSSSEYALWSLYLRIIEGYMESHMWQTGRRGRRDLGYRYFADRRECALCPRLAPTCEVFETCLSRTEFWILKGKHLPSIMNPSLCAHVATKWRSRERVSTAVLAGETY